MENEYQDKVCLRCEAIANSQAEACLLHVNANETEQMVFTITPNSANEYRTCVDLPSNTYDLTAFDVSSCMGPSTLTPAVVASGIPIFSTSMNMSAITTSISVPYMSTSPSINGNLTIYKGNRET